VTSDGVTVHLPVVVVSPLRQVARRMSLALGVLFFVIVTVWLDRDGYNDSADGQVDFLDAAYYSTVTLSTTGYGDVTPVSDFARLYNILVITPLRIVFLVALVGTTIEVLTARTRAEWRERNWRQGLIGHTVIVGFGVKGKAAAKALVESGVRKDRIVVIDDNPSTIAEANELDFVGVLGDATHNAVLQRAAVTRCKSVIVATHDDASSVLVTLSVRRLSKTANIVAAVREVENLPLLTQSGANLVITSAEAAGRLLGLAADKPALGSVAQDLLVTGAGLDISQREVAPDEIGKQVDELPALIVAVLRNEQLLRYDNPTIHQLRRDDHVVVVRSADR
jgi:voltage-gated potassium channel